MSDEFCKISTTFMHLSKEKIDIDYILEHIIAVFLFFLFSRIKIHAMEAQK